MALLDILRKQEKDIVCCHINYHKRNTSDDDQKVVSDYCLKHNIKFYKYDYQNDLKGNFQSLAREFRYQCFKKLAIKYHTNKIAIGHQLEDDLETYLMQLNRKQIPNVYGLLKEINIDDFIIIRPLLDYTKLDLIQYLETNNIKYAIDESNALEKYTRNKIRINIINKLSKEDIKKLLDEKEEKNKELKRKKEEILSFITQNSINYDTFLKYSDYQTMLRVLAKKEFANSSYEEVKEIKRQLLTKKIVKLNESYLVNEDDKIKLIAIAKPYSYQIDKIANVNMPYFKIVSKADSFSSVTISNDDLPLTIRSYQKGDKIKLPYGTKKVSRWFIDHKIPLYKREGWPIVISAKGNIILVPGMGCEFNYYSNNPNLFVVEYY